MTKNYYLRFIMTNFSEDFVFEVREAETERLREILDNFDSTSGRFFWFDCVNGKSVIINLSEVQAVRFLCEPTAAPSDHLRNEDLINVFFKGKILPLEIGTEYLEQLYDLFTYLEYGPENEPYPSLIDEDGELIQFNANEIVMVTAPTQMIDEGRLEVREQENPHN